MSRRKQKFPFHISGEGEASDCQELKRETLVIQRLVEGCANPPTTVSVELFEGAPPKSPRAEAEEDEDEEAVNSREAGRCYQMSSSLVVTVSSDVQKFSVEADSGRNSTLSNNSPPTSPPVMNGVHPGYAMEKILPQPLHSLPNGSPDAKLCAKTGIIINGSNLSLISKEQTGSKIRVKDFTEPVSSKPRTQDFSESHEFVLNGADKCRLVCETKNNNNNIIISNNNNSNCSNSHSNNKINKNESTCFVCPVCQESFKSKRSFNSHILVHCQLIRSPNVPSKRTNLETCEENNVKILSSEINAIEQNEPRQRFQNKVENWDSVLPLDLSCKRHETLLIEHSASKFSPNSNTCKESTGSGKSSFLSSFREHSSSPTLSPPLDPNQSVDRISIKPSDQNHSVLSDRGPYEDENENLVNEAREHEKAFLDTTHNEHFLSEDSTGLEPPPLIPIVSSGGITKKMKVCSDDGPPMVYRIKFHAEQIFVSRILGINEETGDKIELYKCFLCNFSFPSVSRLQAHLLVHKQRFVCRKCNISCDSRIQFSQHVQKEHVIKDSSRETKTTSDSCSESNAENTVTVAALLSALHGSSHDKKNSICEEESEGRGRNGEEEDEEERRSEESFPASPSSGSPLEPVTESNDSGNSVNGGGDIFKMFSCRFCGKKFDRAFSCNRHERVHTGYKPCFCRICGRGFSEPRNLRHHVIRFHSDGSLRHLIKRDRRKRKDEELHSPLSSTEFSTKEVLRECGNKDSNTVVGSLVINRQDQLTTNCTNTSFIVSYPAITNGQNCTNISFQERPNNPSDSETLNNYTTNLTKIFAATLDNSSRIKKPEIVPLQTHYKETKEAVVPGFHDKNHFQVSELGEHGDVLEPGEIRLGIKTKIINDGERGRRLIVTDDSEEGMDHSPQFSSYAPRLNIVQEPVKRDKALIPITDDIGRTFYECPYCLKFFGSTSDLNRHLDFHEDLRPYDCKYCEYSARTNSQLKVHKMRHEGIKQFSCDVCNYNGVTQSDLNRHKKTQSHIARSQNVCSMCGLGFYSTSQKQVHIANCHPEMEGASSLIQMSLGIPHSTSVSTHNGLSSPLLVSASSGAIDNMRESPSRDLTNSSSFTSQDTSMDIDCSNLNAEIHTKDLPKADSPSDSEELEIELPKESPGRLSPMNE